VELLETLEQACAREMMEETGLQVTEMEMAGVVTFVRQANDYHSVCFFFIAHHVEGTLNSPEPDKQTAHWIDVEGFAVNEDIPEYHRDFLTHMLGQGSFMNAKVQWLPPDNRVNGRSERNL
jgi:8-oxo-dGTP diphosphatase